jgi:putative PIN family toxin of toxin-antitoxin system
MRGSERVVLDTNVALSALLFPGGSLARIRAAWHGGEITPLASAATITELIRALTYPKFGLSEMEQRELLADYLPLCEAVVIRDPLDHLPRCRDPHDQIFLELAEAGKAHWLVTGDRDLLALQGQVKCRIATVAEFVADVL